MLHWNQKSLRAKRAAMTQFHQIEILLHIRHSQFALLSPPKDVQRFQKQLVHVIAFSPSVPCREDTKTVQMAEKFAVIDMLLVTKYARGTITRPEDQLMWPTTLQQEEPVYILIVDKCAGHQTMNMHILNTHRLQGGKQHAQPSKQDNLLNREGKQE